MVDYSSTLKRLNREKDYEDGLVRNIYEYFLSCLEDIKGLSEGERREIREGLGTIMKDSQRHSSMFSMMIQMVVENGKDNY